MPRREDERLVTGRGRYAGDQKPEGMARLAVVRSPVPHARIQAINADAARAMPGVLAVITAADLPGSANGIANWAPADQPELMRPVLAVDRVRYAGEAIAAVVAETEYQAQDAAAAVEVDFDLLPAITDVVAAAQPGAPRLHDTVEGNRALEKTYAFGDVAAAFHDAPVVVKETLVASRVCGAAMEPRVATASWNDAEQTLTIWDSTQTVFSVRDTLATALGLEKDQVHVLAHDVGGGFGPKGTVYGEEVLVAVLARQLKRPIKWIASRSEDTATTVHAHGTRIEVEIAAEADGRLRGLRGRIDHDVGAYPGPGNGQPDIIVPHMMSAYAWPAFEVAARATFTNTAPTGFVRGGGRPLGNFTVERLLDRLAAKLGADPADVRRRNLVGPERMPYDTGFPQGRSTVVYDGGDYPRLLEIALDTIGYQDLRRRQHQPSNGRLLGIGIASCVESSGFGSGEPARVRLDPDGTAHLFVGSTPQGQGHETAAAMVLADRLGWPLERITVVAGDSKVVPWALLTAGSRSAIHVGNAVSLVAKSARRQIIDKAAERLEADPVDLVLADGVVSVKGVPGRSLAVGEVFPDGLEVAESFDTKSGTAYSSGCHAVAVEVDPETGGVDIMRYAIVADTGNVINQNLVRGQLQGGLAHGVGYAMFEEAIYTEDGTFQSPTFLDYTMVSAPEMSMPLELRSITTPTEANPEGFKGAGESGSIPAPAAIANAIEDAVRQVRPDAAVTRIPVTPLRVYELLHPDSA
jgi:aerobic carbon-monoxide dehydrogenase large subunit